VLSALAKQTLRLVIGVFLWSLLALPASAHIGAGHALDGVAKQGVSVSVVAVTEMAATESDLVASEFQTADPSIAGTYSVACHSRAATGLNCSGCSPTSCCGHCHVLPTQLLKFPATPGTGTEAPGLIKGLVGLGQTGPMRPPRR